MAISVEDLAKLQFETYYNYDKKAWEHADVLTRDDWYAVARATLEAVTGKAQYDPADTKLHDMAFEAYMGYAYITTGAVMSGADFEELSVNQKTAWLAVADRVRHMACQEQVNVAPAKDAIPDPGTTPYDPAAPRAMTAENVSMLGRMAYAAYGAITDYKNYQGLPMPTYEALTGTIAAAWQNAAMTLYDFGFEHGVQRGYQAASDPARKAVTPAADTAELPATERTEAAPMPGLTEGRIVHFVLKPGEHRAAIVTTVSNAVTGLCDLTVFFEAEDVETDYALYGEEDDLGKLGTVQLVKLVEHDPSGNSKRTWHWMEKA